MMQSNALEAIRNNVLGTRIVAEAAARFGTEKVVLVSTDKAVRPRSVMGASKRLAEIAVLELQEKYPETMFAAVRFGNVLGSSGSVIPIFKQQIEEGNPLTVTHPECTRYFMMIPEAVHLILQASLLSELRGHIAMLEMGEPIRIVDLAKTMLRMSGMPTRENEQIVFVGLRAGEKMHEELVAPDEETAPTSVQKVRLIAPTGVRHIELAGWFTGLEEWLREARERDAVRFLVALFPTLDVSLNGGWDEDRAAPANQPAARAPTVELVTNSTNASM